MIISNLSKMTWNQTFKISVLSKILSKLTKNLKKRKAFTDTRLQCAGLEWNQTNLYTKSTKLSINSKMIIASLKSLDLGFKVNSTDHPGLKKYH